MPEQRSFRFRVAGWTVVLIAFAAGTVVLSFAPLLAAIGMKGNVGGTQGLSTAQISLSTFGLALFAAAVWLLVRCMRIAVVVRPDGIEVRNVLHTVRLPWTEVQMIEPFEIKRFVPLLGLRLRGTAKGGRVRDVEMTATLAGAQTGGVILLPLVLVLETEAARHRFTVVRTLHGETLPGLLPLG